MNLVVRLHVMLPVLEITPVTVVRCQSSVKFWIVLVDRSRGFLQNCHSAYCIKLELPGDWINNNMN